MGRNVEPIKTDQVTPLPRWFQPLNEYGPLAVFFAAYVVTDLYWATAALVVATAVALGFGFAITRRIPLMPLITAAVVGVFGILTLILQDETFIKMKPTILQALFAAILLGGLAIGQPLLKPLFGATWALDDVGWRKLTFRFGVFFLAMAVLNEVIWRTQSTDFWVSSMLGKIVLTFVFVISQAPVIRRHRLQADGGAGSAQGASERQA
jgi:intracellular septation protein